MRKLIFLRPVCWKFAVRSFSSIPELAEAKTGKKCHSRMSGWQIHQYSDNTGDLQFTEILKKPLIRSPSEVVVKISASSVNPLDVAMMSGYGSTLFNTMRCNKSDIEFPLTLGRDFVGTVVNKGLGIKGYSVGDKVWGVVPVHLKGCHSEYISIDKAFISEKPKNLSDVDASAVLYAGLTAWSGIFVSGQLAGIIGGLCRTDDPKKKKVLVLGAAGGVGNLATQILQAEGVEVVATCSTDAVPIIQNLGVTKVIDYTSEESNTLLISESPYDIILDCAGRGAAYATALPWTYGSFVTFKSPMLKNFDAHGLIAGGFANVRDIVTNNLPVLSGDGSVKWGFFWPSQSGIYYLKELAENGKLLPIIDSVFPYDRLPDAYQKVQNGHLRGKVVVDFTKTSD